MAGPGVIVTYDTTLRDGTQREGLTLSVEDKLRIAARLDALGVTYIEGGFPGSNPKDIEFFDRMDEVALSTATIVAFGSTCHKDAKAEADPGLNALLDTGCSAITIFGKCWDLHVVETLRTSLERNLEMVSDSVAYLKGAGRTVFFDAEHFFDGYKANPGYAVSVCAAAAGAGADAVVLCDTNGGTLPFEVAHIVAQVVEALPGVSLGIHAHNDTGCAVANSLVAVEAGAVHVQGTVNGYGERAGNADLIAIIPSLELKMGRSAIGHEGLEQLTETAHFVAETANIAPDAHQPYVGTSAFAHKGGVHASGAARLAEAYEHVDPRLVGNFARVVVSELAGRASLVSKARELGYEFDASDPLVDRVVSEVKRLEHHGYSFEVADASLELLLRSHLGRRIDHFRLESFRVIAEKREDGRVMTEATIKVHVGGERFVTTAEGNGPVNALDKALRLAITRYFPHVEQIELSDFKVRVLDETVGTEAVTRVLIESTDGEDSWGTVGVSENVIEASWEALVDSIEYGLSRYGTTSM